MKRMSAILMFFLAAVAFGIAKAQEAPVFAPPVPARSAETQTGPDTDSTKTDATQIMFFDHPSSAVGNFERDTVRIGSRDYAVGDIAATPGLLPPDDRIIDEDSLMLYGYRRSGVTMNPIHGFCPGTFELEGEAVTLDCQVGDADEDDDPLVYESRQIEIADIRRALEAELSLVSEQDPVVAALIGSSHENIFPYTASTYPATVMSKEKVLMMEACQCHYDSEHPESCRWNVTNTPTPAPYDEVVAYGMADLGAGVVTAVYDTFFVAEKMRFNRSLSGDSPVRTAFYELQLAERPHTWPYMSPLAFFFKDPSSPRMRLDGYSAAEIHTFFGGREPREYVLGSGIPIETNINPIAVVSMDVDSSNGFAVVNQSSIVNLDALVKLNGAAYFDPLDGFSHPWADYFTLRDGSDIDAAHLPHRIVSYVTFWKEDESLRWGDPSRSPDSFNSNASFKAIGAALVGPGMFSAAKITDTVDGVQKERLVVPSGEPAGDGKYYIYKIDPQSEEKLQVKMDATGALSVGSEAVELQTVLADPTEVPQTPLGFAPHGIACGDLNRDGCGDCAITFRGSMTVAVSSVGFTNAKGQHVMFKSGDPANPAMFSDSVLVYYGKREGMECVFSNEESYRLIITVSSQDPENPAQVASVTLGDVDGNGTTDLVVGDLIPREIEGRPEKYAPHVYLYFTGPDGLFVSLISHQNVLVGFKTVDGAVTAGDLLNIMNGLVPEKIAGVAAVALDEHAGWGANIGAINGIPLMLPKIGCPRDGNAEVLSIGEMLLTGALPESCGPRARVSPPGGIPGPGDDDDGTGDSFIGGPGAQMTDPQPPPEDDETQFAYRTNFEDSNFPRDTGIRLAQLGGLPLGGLPHGAMVRTGDLLFISCNPASPPKIFDPLSVLELPVPVELGGPHMPRGQIMPGQREITWVVKYVPEPPAVEEPETPEPPAIPPSGPGATTTTTTTPPPPALPPPELGTPTFKNDCVARVLTYSSSEMKQKISELNRDYIQKPTGRSDEIFVEPGQTMCFFCRFEDALTPEGAAALSAKGTAIPAQAGDVMPSVFAQTGGAMLTDIHKYKYKKVSLVKEPLIIAPAGGGAGKSALFASLSEVSLMNAVPMPIETMANLSGGGLMLNNAIEMRSYIAPIDRPFTLNMGSDVGITLESGAPSSGTTETESRGAAILSYCITQPLDYASFAGMAGYTDAPKIEDRKLDVNVISDELTARTKDAPDGKPTIDVFYGLDWEDNLNIRHVVAMETAKGMVTRKMAGLEVTPGMFAEGGGCKSCKNSITGLPPTVDSILPTLIAVLFAMSGIMAGKAGRVIKMTGKTPILKMRRSFKK